MCVLNLQFVFELLIFKEGISQEFKEVVGKTENRQPQIVNRQFRLQSDFRLLVPAARNPNNLAQATKEVWG